MLYELILINEIEQRAKIIFLSVHANKQLVNSLIRNWFLNWSDTNYTYSLQFSFKLVLIRLNLRFS